MAVEYPMLARGTRGGVQWTLAESPDGRCEIGLLLHGRVRSVLTLRDKMNAMSAFCRLSDIRHGFFSSDEQVYLRLRAAAADLGGSLQDERVS